MNLKDKPVQPIIMHTAKLLEEPRDLPFVTGLTYYQWLIGMLASNASITDDLPDRDNKSFIHASRNARRIINQADAIIKELEK